MTDTTADTSSAETPGLDDFTLWYDFQFTKFKTDPIRWNKDWEKALSSLSASDVYTRLGQPYYRKSWDQARTPEHKKYLTERVCKPQEVLVQLWDKVRKDGHFFTAWLLLEEKERRRHLMKGFEDGLPHVEFQQDARSLAPEITTTSMLKQNGQAFIQFLDKYADGKKDMTEGSLYLLPSEWWDNALKEVSQSIIDGADESTYELLTLHRNQFITNFLSYSVMSVLHDLSRGSPGMNPVTDFMKEDSGFAAAMASTVASVLDKPIIRCENCTKNAEEIGKDKKFMQCSSCKSKLDFIVHYCSVGCQKQDWPNHKKHCGKKKVAKGLKGTVHDQFWNLPETPNYLRNLPANNNGNVALTSLGFPDSANAPTQSPALQRQVSLLTANNAVDYFLFDEQDRPVPFDLGGGWLKMTYRIIRSEVLSTSNHNGVETLMEQVIKVMGEKPGLGRERIIAQFVKEYGEGVVGRFAKFEQKALEEGRAGRTLIENMCQNFSRMTGI